MSCAGTPSDISGQPPEPTVTPFPTAPAAARRTILAERGTVEETLSFNGRWLPRDQFPLSFEISGSIRRVEVARNAVVAAGDLLADFQIEDLENQLVNQQLTLETARLRLEGGEEGGVNSVVNAQFQLANARLELESQRNSVDWASVANAQLSLQDAQNRLDDAQRNYDSVIGRADSSPSAIDQAYQSLRDAEIALTREQNNYYSAAQRYNNSMDNLKRQENNVLQQELALEQAESGAGADVDQVQAVRSAEIAVEQTEEKIRQSSLYSPIDGVVLDITVQPGDQVEAFRAVITVAKPEPLEAIATLAFNDTQRLSVGDIGVCHIANRPETAVQCIIRQLPLNSRDADQTTRVAASLDDVPLGQAIEIIMPLERREDVVWLPPGYVRTFQARTFVIVLRGDDEFVQDVVVGLRTPEREEIVSGLEAGDVVVAP